MSRPNDVVAAQVVKIRKKRGWTQADLAKRLATLGYDQLKRTNLAKVERGTRRVNIEDVLALAAALDVAPVHLFVPYDREHVIEITPTVRVPAHTVRRWVHGWSPLPGGDDQQYFSEMPREEWWVQRNPQVRKLGELFERVALASVAPERQQDADELYDRLAGNLERLMRSVEVEVDDLTSKGR